MPKCQFTTKYYDYEIREVIDFNCPEEEPLASGFCIFHDKDYLQDMTNNEDHKRKVLDRMKIKVNHAISYSKRLLCIGFQLPDFSLSDLNNSKVFTKPINFSGSQFFGKASFSIANFQGGASFNRANFQGEAFFYGANFKGRADFSEVNFKGRASFLGTKFQGEADFSNAKFQGKANFYSANFQHIVNFRDAEFYAITNFGKAEFKRVGYYRTKFKKRVNFKGATFYGEVDFIKSDFADGTIFEYIVFYSGDKTFFDVTDLSKASFLNTDLTRVRFSDKARWGEKKVEYDKFWRRKKVNEDRFKIIDERLLEEKIREKDCHTTKDLNLGSIKAVYRNLRENYEYRMRYDEAGQFFIREMELKRKYREVVSPKDDGFEVKVKQNNWFRRNLFSLTGWYYHLSRYGESIWRPALAGVVIVLLSTLFWLMQSNPTLEPSLSTIECNPNVISDATRNGTSKFISLCEHGSGNHTHWLKAFERGIADFIPLLPLGSNIKVGIIDYVIKIVGGAVTFGLIAIALRRRFERRYRH